MSLQVAYSYCAGLSEKEKIEIDKQVRKNQKELIIASIFTFNWLPGSIPTTIPEKHSVDTFVNPVNYVQKKKEETQRAARRKIDHASDKASEFVNKAAAKTVKKAVTKTVENTVAGAVIGSVEDVKKFKVIRDMSPTLAKTAKKLRKNEKACKTFDNLATGLENGDFKRARGAQPLKGSKVIFSMRAGDEYRVYFVYGKKGEIRIVAETNKAKQQYVIDNLLQQPIENFLQQQKDQESK